ncbi:NAD(P)-binding domain-containing protein [Pseudomonas sp. EL_65y_Pfl2_R95]|uniref:NAD(P)-binding domain-containing protein n=1 Tax=Pseudomonas sp. EL_65y_Pfl2_R95 TaxID=3088698 RepID=UPI0040408988
MVNIGFIGTGSMGRAVTPVLMKAGHHIVSSCTSSPLRNWTPIAGSEGFVFS